MGRIHRAVAHPGLGVGENLKERCLSKSWSSSKDRPSAEQRKLGKAARLRVMLGEDPERRRGRHASNQQVAWVAEAWRRRRLDAGKGQPTDSLNWWLFPVVRGGYRLSCYFQWYLITKIILLKLLEEGIGHLPSWLLEPDD